MNKIYKIVCSDGHWYVGSTKALLINRLAQHTYMAKQRPAMKVYKHILSLGWDNVKIELIKEVKSNVLQEETNCINLDDPLCLNSRPAYSTKEERKKKDYEAHKLWKQNNREKHLENRKEWRDKRRQEETEEQKQKRRQYHREYMKERRMNNNKVYE
jgi:hypothetical protein